SDDGVTTSLQLSQNSRPPCSIIKDKYMMKAQQGGLLASFLDREHEGGDTRSQGGIEDNDSKIKIQDHSMQMISKINSQDHKASSFKKASHISFASAILWNFSKWSSGKAISKVVLAFLSLSLAITSLAILEETVELKGIKTAEEEMLDTIAYQDDSKSLVTIDEEDIDLFGHVEEDTQNYAMMDYSSSNSGSDNE
nr:hypothetical protein [Tanacetum cinerariifolium]GFA61845.1 hypothetical protein [Tanacetum cinerariifolium]